jgi:hypothetical protein
VVLREPQWRAPAKPAPAAFQGVNHHDKAGSFKLDETVEERAREEFAERRQH